MDEKVLDVQGWADPECKNFDPFKRVDFPQWCKFQTLCRLVLEQQENITRLGIELEDLRGELRDAKREIDRLQGRSEPYG